MKMHIKNIGKICKVAIVPISLICPKIIVGLYGFLLYPFNISLAFSQNLSSSVFFSWRSESDLYTYFQMVWNSESPCLFWSLQFSVNIYCQAWQSERHPENPLGSDTVLFTCMCGSSLEFFLIISINHFSQYLISFFYPFNSMSKRTQDGQMKASTSDSMKPLFGRVEAFSSQRLRSSSQQRSLMPE